MRWLLVGLLGIPLADALLLVVVADVLGWPITVLLVVLTALLGMLAVRAEGRHTIRRIQERLARGELPTDELLDGGLLIAAGAFLLTPGVVTDALGFLLAVPVTRYPIRLVVKRYGRRYVDVKTGGFATGSVYTAGFPEEEGGFDVAGEDVFEVNPDDYDVGPDGGVGDDAFEVDVDDPEDDDGA